MNIITQISPPSFRLEVIEEPKECIRVKIFPDPCPPENVVSSIAAIEGPVDLYTWYEGSQCLPKIGADFLKKSLFESLYRLKQDVKVYLYSLRAWDFKRNVSKMQTSTPIGKKINTINQAAIECIYSSSFFKYCAEIQTKSGLYLYLNQELPKKKWSFDLSADQKERGITIAKLFNQQGSVFNCINELDVSAAYSIMQYVEGYYLIQESVKRGLLNGQKKIQIAFVLPNDESKYYLDYPQEIKKMLRLDFGEEVSDLEIDICFRFFEYGDSLCSRPYIDKRRGAPKVKPEEIFSYFDFLSKSLSKQVSNKGKD